MLILCGIKKQHKDSIASVFSFTQSHYFFGIRVVIKTHLKPRFNLLDLSKDIEFNAT